MEGPGFLSKEKGIGRFLGTTSVRWKEHEKAGSERATSLRKLGHRIVVFIQGTIPGEASAVFVEPEEDILYLLVKLLDLLLHPLSRFQQFADLGFGVHPE